MTYMPRSLLTLLITATLLTTSLAYAQDDDKNGDENKRRKPPTEVTEKLSRAVYEQIDLAQKALEAKNLGKAESIMNQLNADSDKFNDYEKAQIYNFLAAIHYEQGKQDATIKDYKNILRLKKIPEQLRNNSLFRLAQIYFVKEEYDTSIKVLDVWLKQVDSVRPEAYMLKAQAYYQLGDFEKAKPAALNALKEARRRDQRPQESWLALLRAVYYELGDYQTAAKLLELMIAQYPKPSYYKQLAGMYGLLEQQEKQLEVMHAAYVADMIDNESEILNVARLYMAQDAPYPAVELIQNAMDTNKVDPEKAENLQLLAQAMALAKEYDQQIPVLKKAAKLTGEGKQYLYLGQAQIALYEWSDAAQSLQKAVNAGGIDNPGSVYMQIGSAYYNLKNYDAARRAFGQASRYDNYSTQAQQWLKFVDLEVKREKAITQGL